MAIVHRWQPPPATAVAAAADPPVGGQELRAAVLGGGHAITYPPADEDEALLAEERAGGRYEPVGGYPPDGGGCRSRGPRRRWAERPLRQQAVVTSATATTAPMAAILVSFLLLSRSYVRSQATSVVRARLVYLSFVNSVKIFFSFQKAREFSRARFQYTQQCGSQTGALNAVFKKKNAP